MPAAGEPEVSVAVVGAGSIAAYHVEGLRSAGGARVAAIVGRRRDATAQQAQALGIPRAETDPRAVLDDRSIDAVVIATPDHTHKALAIEALQAGKAVLLQKPMALTSGECREILAAEKQSGSRLTVSFMHRYFPEVLWLRELLAGGTLGSIHSVRMRNATPGADWNAWFYEPGKVSGGAVMQLGVHGIDLCRHLFGPIRDVSAEIATSRPVRTLSDGQSVAAAVEDTAAVTYRFAGGALGTHEVSSAQVAGCDRFRLEVHAEHGTVWLRSERGAAALFAPAVTGREEWMVPTLPAEPFGAAHHRHWLAIVRGRAPRDDTPEAGLATLLVAEAIYRSAAEGRRIAVEDVPRGAAC